MDGGLALPTNILGLVYVVASYQPCENGKANIAVISTQNNNNIIIFANKNAVIYHREILYDGKSSQIYITQVLQKLDALYISASSDLSGTVVIASKPVTVISGVSCAPMPFGWYSSLEATLLPVSLWGNEYILATVGNMDKSQGDHFRIFAFENNTVVKSTHWTKVLSTGMYTELVLGTNLTSFIRCSKPCQVVQYIIGDKIYRKYVEPSMIVVPAVSQFLSYYHVSLPHGSEFHDAITVVIDGEYINGLYMNGLKLNSLRWERVRGTKYVWTVISLSDPTEVTVYHASSLVKFGLIVLGWNNVDSFAYAGGFDLQKKTDDGISALLSSMSYNKSRLRGM
ncbi:uncharacterized protein LOC114533421 [Dendronephthya gigantea]|uniref:uncharacterized protein LOC114533421 n=1 Tax=Dendronephthya gigantea TaxID=151771 RepID=UPI00106BCC09|nr:uncharacterized protein LOC114533421 [Dendronephthya gigantea]